MAEINFIETDAQTIYETVMSRLMDYCNEALYPGDERRMFGEALTVVLVSLYYDFNDKSRQRLLQFARGTVLDAIGARYNVARSAASKAVTMFRFTVSAVQSGNIVIPIGTRVTAVKRLFRDYNSSSSASREYVYRCSRRMHGRRSCV
jgi:hypothetical protein